MKRTPIVASLGGLKAEDFANPEAKPSGPVLGELVISDEELARRVSSGQPLCLTVLPVQRADGLYWVAASITPDPDHTFTELEEEERRLREERQAEAKDRPAI